MTLKNTSIRKKKIVPISNEHCEFRDKQPAPERKINLIILLICH